MGTLFVLLLENLRLTDSEAVVIFGRKFASAQPSEPFTKWFTIDDLDFEGAEEGRSRQKLVGGKVEPDFSCCCSGRDSLKASFAFMCPGNSQ